MNRSLWKTWVGGALAGLLGTLGLGLLFSGGSDAVSKERAVSGAGWSDRTPAPRLHVRPVSEIRSSGSGSSNTPLPRLKPGARQRPGAGQKHRGPAVRLNAVQVPWGEFLRHLARQTGSQLVMRKSPPGRFNHLGTRLYTRQEAIELVNEQLQPLGYRVLDQGRHLVVVELEQLRTRYPRYRLVPQRSPAAKAEPGSVRGLLRQSVGGSPLRGRRRTQVATITRRRDEQETTADATHLIPPGGQQANSGVQQAVHQQQTTESGGTLPRLKPEARQPQRKFPVAGGPATGYEPERLGASAPRPGFTPQRKLPVAGGPATGYEPERLGASAPRPGFTPQRKLPVAGGPATPGRLQPPAARQLPGVVPAAEKPSVGETLDGDGHHGPMVVRLQRWQAVEVARVLYRAFRQQAALVERGPEGLPGFEVFAPGDAPAAQHPLQAAGGQEQRLPGKGTPRLFAVGIDSSGNRLVIEGPAQWRHAVVTAANVVDSLPPKPNQAVELVPSRKPLAGKGQVIQAALNQLVAQAPAPGQGGQRPDAAPDEQPKQNNQPPAQRPPAPQGQQGEPILRIDALRGPVTIQDVPGIGLVVTGNKEDVDAVVRIIRELERVAGAAVPDIHLLVLQHVNSESLAALLNSVYQELGAIRSPTGTQVKRASVLPVVRPNALLIIASQGDIQAISQLAAQLDKPLDPQSEVQVFPLRHAVATQVVAALESLYPETQPQGQQAAPGLAPRVRAVADVRTNTVIVQARPRDLKEVALVIQRLDRDDSAAVNQMRVFPLRHAVASELAEVINAAIQSVLNPPPAPTVPGQATGQLGAAAAQGQVPQQLREIKSVALEFLTTQGQAQKLVRSGVLADVRVTADPRINALIVTAPQQSMELMAALIAHLDRPSPAVAEIKVFTLANSDATTMAELLQNLFATDGQQPGGQTQAQGVQLVGAEGIGSTLVPLRFSVDVRTNSIIAMGGADALRVVEAILLRLDQTDVRQRQSTVIRLKNSPAADVAEAINQFLQSQRELMEIDPELVSNIELLEREIIVVPEPVSNSLLISATPRYYEEILELVRKLDQAPAQVVIQALLVEVELENTDEFGVELGFQDSVLFDRSLLNLDNFQTIQQTVTNIATGVATTTETIVNEERIPGFLFNNQQLGNNTRAHPSRVGTQGLSSFSVGRINGDLGFGGLVLSASSESVSVLIRALAARRKVRILSRPQIRTLDNQLAVIHVGQQVPVISGATTNQAGGVTPVIGTPQLVGIILQVTPRISPDGTIVMETIATKSAISGQGVPILTDPSTGNVIESPIFDLTEARTTVAVPDGQTVVIGGMITKREDVIERRVPWLGDLPLLGVPFRYDAKVTRRTELLIFLTPRIVHSAEEAELIKQVEIQRLHFDLHEAEAVHGPIMSVLETPPGEQGKLELLPLPSEKEQSQVPTTVMPPQQVEPQPEKSSWYRRLLPGRLFGRRTSTIEQAATAPDHSGTGGVR